MEIDKKELIAMYEEFGNIRSVALKLNVSVTTAWNLLKEAGVKMNKKKYTLK